tara:strand:- start:7263 stop:9290 length:2028 start_codon:yes stop_codon:yes gene_type:complete
MKRIFLITLISYLLISCKHDLEKPIWDTNIIIPIAHTKMDINNLLPDSNISIDIDEDNFITLVYEQKFINLNVDSLIKVDAIADEQVHTLDSVIFADVVIADTFTVGQAIAELDTVNDLGFFLFPNGSQNDIPAMPSIMNNRTITINASEYFENMTLYRGWLIINLINNFPVDISNVSLSLINETNQDIIASFNFALIPSGTIATDSADVSGKSLDKNLSAIVHNLDINASNGNVLINYEDAIITEITLADIGVTEATAIFPEQQLTETLKEHSFDLGTAQIKEIGIKSGTVKVNVLSTLPNGKMIYNIPSLTKNGASFMSGDMIVPQATNADPITIPFDFEGYVLDLTGKNGRLGGDTVNTLYSEAYTYIDSSGTLETINYTDSFYSFIEFNLVPEYAIGFLGQDTVEITENEINFDVMNKIKTDNLDLDEVELKLNIKNYIGADAQLDIIKLRSENENGDFIDLFENYSISIDRASLTNNQLPINSTLSETTIDANKFIEILPNKIISQANFYINPNGQSSTLDFLYPEYPLEASLSIDIPLRFIANNLTFTDTNNVNISVDNDIEIEKIYITINNGLPFSANLELRLLDENNQEIGILLENQTILAASMIDGMVSESKESTLVLDYHSFEDVKKIVSISSFSTEPNNEFINIYSDYKIDIKISAKFNRTIGE